jgi:hypothetical protein
MGNEKPDRVAEYVLGLMSPNRRDVMARTAEVDEQLAGEIACWNERLAGLYAEEVPPPPGLFDRIEAAIGTRSQHLPGSATVRAEDGHWESLGEGVERKVLFQDAASKRVTFLVRGVPGARFPEHDHDDEEECYVISGDITFGTLRLDAGDYHRARRGMRHPAASTVGGCVLLMTAAA